jgi:hypothetical protein
MRVGELGPGERPLGSGTQNPELKTRNREPAGSVLTEHTGRHGRILPRISRMGTDGGLFTTKHTKNTKTVWGVFNRVPSGATSAFRANRRECDRSGSETRNPELRTRNQNFGPRNMRKKGDVLGGSERVLIADWVGAQTCCARVLVRCRDSPPTFNLNLKPQRRSAPAAPARLQPPPGSP